MDKLFSIDARAREEKMDHAARHTLRQEKAPSVLNEIREHIQTTRQTVLPGSKAAQACKYTLTLWEKLIRFLDHPRLELSNNLAENSMRPVALGRSNWIHIGRPAGRTTRRRAHAHCMGRKHTRLKTALIP